MNEKEKGYCSYWEKNTEKTETCSGWLGRINPLKQGVYCGTCNYYSNMKELCTHCGHSWYKRIENPVQCPKCRRRYYEKEKD